MVNGPKDTGENSGDVEQTDKDKARNRSGTTVHSRDNRSSKDGEGTMDKSRANSQAKKKLENRIMERMCIRH